MDGRLHTALYRVCYHWYRVQYKYLTLRCQQRLPAGITDHVLRCIFEGRDSETPLEKCCQVQTAVDEVPGQYEYLLTVRKGLRRGSLSDAMRTSGRGPIVGRLPPIPCLASTTYNMEQASNAKRSRAEQSRAKHIPFQLRSSQTAASVPPVRSTK